MRLFTTIRARLLLLVALCTLPAFGILFYDAWDESNRQIERASEALRLRAQQSAYAMDGNIRATALLLRTLERIPEIRGLQAPACSQLLAELIGSNQGYANVLVSRPDGDLVCSATPFAGRVNYAERELFQRALASPEVVFGTPVTGRITGKTVFPMWHAIRDDSQRVIAVVTMGLDLEWFARLTSSEWTYPGTAMVFWDREARVVFRWPDPEQWIGKPFGDTSLGETILAQASGAFSAPGVDGIERVLGFARIDESGELGLKLNISVPNDVLVAESRAALARNVTTLALLTLIVFGIAWALGEVLIRRRLTALAHASERVGAGDLTARVGAPYQRDEIGDMARSFDAMAAQVQGHNAELQHLNVQLENRVAEHQQAEAKVRRLNRVYAVLSSINSLIVRVRDRQELLNEACRIAVDHGNFGMAWIGTYDPAAQEVTPVAWAGVEASEYLGGVKTAIRNDTPEERGILAQAIQSRRPVFSNDITIDPEVGGKRREAAIRCGYRSVIVLPLMVEGEVVGNMSLLARELNFVTEEELKLLTELAGDISFSLEHIAKAEKLEKLSRIRLVSGEINAAIVRIGERETLLRETCRIAAEHGKFDLIWIAQLDEEKKEITPVAWAGFSQEAAHAVSWASISSAQGTLGEAIRTRKAAVRNDIEVELPGGKLRQEALNKGCRSTVCLPLAVDDNVVALIVLFATGRGFFDADELALLNEMAADVSFALQSISRREKVEYLSYYDVLTGLPNRRLFIDRVSQQMRARSGEQRMVALVLLDLDRFRNINETLGRHGGDELLKLAARRLEHVFRSRDYLAHIGADNFGVVIRGVQDAAEIAHVVESQVLACFREPFVVNDRELRVVARTGIALFPNDGGDADILFKNAEAALRNAKASHERYLFYAPQMNARVAEQLKIENQLRVAVLEEQFVLHYQPRIEFATGRICGLEALIRWMHPERGLVPPGEFIPILESTGMILEVGRWALKRAALDHAAWRAAGLKPPRIAVNVSAIQLRRKEFVENVRTALSEAGDSGEHIDVEITESMLMDDIEGNIEKLKAVQAMGMQVAMDDFGTGYSSLSYLARLPINSLKIDRSFVSQMTRGSEQMAIVTTVILLARALNLKVVAEGVETEEQAQLLRQLKCDEAQGYLFGRPVPPKDLEGKLGQA